MNDTLSRCVTILQTIFFIEVAAGGVLGIILLIAFGFTAVTFFGLLTIAGFLGFFWAITKGFEEMCCVEVEFDSIRRKINDLESKIEKMEKTSDDKITAECEVKATEAASDNKAAGEEKKSSFSEAFEKLEMIRKKLK